VLPLPFHEWFRDLKSPAFQKGEAEDELAWSFLGWYHPVKQCTLFAFVTARVVGFFPYHDFLFIASGDNKIAITTILLHHQPPVSTSNIFFLKHSLHTCTEISGSSNEITTKSMRLSWTLQKSTVTVKLFTILLL